MDFEKYLAKEWTKVETWEEAHRLVAEIIAVNEFLEKRKNFYKEQLTERSAQLVRAIRMLQEEGINFEMEDLEVDWRNVFRELVQTATAEEDFSTWKEVKAKAHASGELAELLNDELNQKENDDER